MARHRPHKIVGYVRTSTDDQLLGIDAQEDRLRDIARRNAYDVDQVFVEHESGGDNDRPELDKALRHARRIKAHLVVAKLDRLARDQTFLMKLVDGNVPIIFGDLENLDVSTPEGRMMLQVFGTFAEFERRRIGSRTREALRILKARGIPLGASNPKCRNLTPEARARGVVAAARNRTARAIEEQSDVAAIAAELRAEGLSLRKIAAHLNAEGYPTRDGSVPTLDPKTGRTKGGWSAVQVKRVLDRARTA
jgi:DNA invertase Pin-like site-specific DNA recombinase